MNTARLQAPAAFAASSIVIRTINVNQNLFPGPGKTFRTTVDLGLGWASSPVSLIVGDRNLPVAMLQGTKGSKFTVSIPALSDGLHSATVKLENGVEVRVVLNVRSTHD